MGIMNGLGRFLTGKPAFEGPNSASDGKNIQSSEKPANGVKSIPLAIISSVECDLSGDDMTCSVTIHNQSGVEIFLDKIRLINTTKELDASLRAGQEKEYYAVFRGDRPKHANYKVCELEYRNTSGDYFKSVHTVEYNYEPDGTYSLRRMRFVPPVRDI